LMPFPLHFWRGGISSALARALFPAPPHPLSTVRPTAPPPFRLRRHAFRSRGTSRSHRAQRCRGVPLTTL